MKHLKARKSSRKKFITTVIINLLEHKRENLKFYCLLAFMTYGVRTERNMSHKIIKHEI